MGRPSCTPEPRAPLRRDAVRATRAPLPPLPIKAGQQAGVELSTGEPGRSRTLGPTRAANGTD
eukprot:7880394-Pyramimonas_sp.AAC.1